MRNEIAIASMASEQIEYELITRKPLIVGVTGHSSVIGKIRPALTAFGIDNRRKSTV